MGIRQRCSIDELTHRAGATPDDAHSYRLKIRNSVAQFSRAQWQSLVPDDQPFVSWDFLDALEKNNCIRASYGWQSAHLELVDARNQSVAFAPAYLKGNSHGEFVFDYAWAHAYQQNGLDYYPKLLLAVPYSPVTAPKFFAHTLAHKRLLISAVERYCTASRLSSAHVNFLTEHDASLLTHEAWLPRFDWQFHWANHGYSSFDDFLAMLSPKKRKNILQERRKVRDAGVRIERRTGDQLDAGIWPEVHRLYEATFDHKGNTPVLTAAFFADLATRMPEQIVLSLAYQGDQLIAMAYMLRSKHTLYGRYWGADLEVPGLHFECCYYQGIEHCIQHGLACFEPGAQGEHKLARGFLPTRTRSAHCIAHPEFRRAIRHAIDQEGKSLRRYQQELLAHSPYR